MISMNHVRDVYLTDVYFSCVYVPACVGGFTISVCALGEDTTISPLKPSVPQHYLINDLEAPLLTQVATNASVNGPAPDAEHRQRRTHWLLVCTTILITVAACQTHTIILLLSFWGLLMASIGLIWLRMQPDMQVGSMPLTKVSRPSIADLL